MNKVDRESPLNGIGIEKAYSRFLCVYNNVWNEYVPIKGNIHSKKRGEWISKETLVRQKHMMWYKIRSDKDKAEYRRQGMNLTKSINKEKIKWESELASRAKNDPKLIYSYIRSKIDVKEQIKALKDDEGRLTVEKSEIADILNNHFESIIIKETPDLLPEFENRINVNFGIPNTKDQ